MTYAIAAVVFVTVLDIITTIIALRRGFTEANPIMEHLMDTLGGAWWIAKAALTGVLAYGLYGLGSVAGLWVVAAVLGAVVLNNIRHLMKDR